MASLHEEPVGGVAGLPPGFSVADLSAASEVSRPSSDAPFRIYTLDELKSEPAPDYLVEGILKPQDLAFFFGAPGSGKSFALIDLAVVLAKGEGKWANRFDIKRKSKTLYCTGEGQSSLIHRFEAAIEAHDLPATVAPQLYVAKEVPQLFDGDEAGFQAFLDVCRGAEVDLVVIDTLALAIVGGDENIQRAAGIVVGKIKRIQQEVGCAVLIAHHAGKTGAFRGSTAFVGAADLILKFEESGGTYRMEASKVKDAERFSGVRFRLSRSLTNDKWMSIEWLGSAAPEPDEKAAAHKEMIGVLVEHARSEGDAMTFKQIQSRMQRQVPASTLRTWLAKAHGDPEVAVKGIQKKAAKGREEVWHYYAEQE